jgi:hypothetical protein
MARDIDWKQFLREAKRFRDSGVRKPAAAVDNQTTLRTKDSRP